MFELETMTKTKLTEIGVLSQKNRDPDDNPGAALQFEMSVSNEMLSMFDGSLRSFLYYKSAAGSDGAQSRMDVEVNDLPNLTEAGQKIGKLHWSAKLVGYKLTIDYGLGATRKSNLELEDCEVSRFVFAPKEGGTTEIGFLIEAPDVPEKIYGKLPALKNREVQIKLTPPSLDDAQQDVEE